MVLLTIARKVGIKAFKKLGPKLATKTGATALAGGAVGYSLKGSSKTRNGSGLLRGIDVSLPFGVKVGLSLSAIAAGLLATVGVVLWRTRDG